MFGTRSDARAVLLRDVDRDAEVHGAACGCARAAVGLAVGVVHPRVLLERAHDRPGDEVREGDLREAERLAVAVQDPPVLLHRLDGDDPVRGGGRDAERGLHVPGDRGGAAGERRRPARRRARPRAAGARRGRSAAARGGADGAAGSNIRSGSGAIARAGTLIANGNALLERPERPPPVLVDESRVEPVEGVELEGERRVVAELLEHGVENEGGGRVAHEGVNCSRRGPFRP